VLKLHRWDLSRLVKGKRSVGVRELLKWSVFRGRRVFVLEL
jgi:hypothetical protein